MRQILSTAIVALVVAALTAVTVSAMAQSGPESVNPAAVSDIDAHRVDGRHAVGAGASRARRAGKLVATDSDGYLPSDILSPRPVTDIDLTSVERAFTIPGNSAGQRRGRLSHVHDRRGWRVQRPVHGRHRDKLASSEGLRLARQCPQPEWRTQGGDRVCRLHGLDTMVTAPRLLTVDRHRRYSALVAMTLPGRPRRRSRIPRSARMTRSSPRIEGSSVRRPASPGPMERLGDHAPRRPRARHRRFHAWKAAALLWDPTTGEFTETGSPPMWNVAFNATTLLDDGRVLIMGSYGDGRDAAVWDPATGTFTEDRDPVGAARWQARSTLLDDGRVFVIGGAGGSAAEVWDPDSGTFTPLDAVGSLEQAQRLVTLDGGRVIVFGPDVLPTAVAPSPRRSGTSLPPA